MLLGRCFSQVDNKEGMDVRGLACSPQLRRTDQEYPSIYVVQQGLGTGHPPERYTLGRKCVT